MQSEAKHTSFLYYSTFQWLFHGNVSSCTFELWQEIFIFLKEKDHKNIENVVNDIFLIKLA